MRRKDSWVAHHIIDWMYSLKEVSADRELQKLRGSTLRVYVAVDRLATFSSASAHAPTRSRASLPTAIACKSD